MLLVPYFRGLARHLHLACLALTVAAASVLAQTNAPSAADGFDPNVDGTVFAIAKQPSDGKLVVVGQFSSTAPNGGDKVLRYNIARFNADGTLDTTFNTNANAPVRAVVVQPNGDMIIGGDFTVVNDNPHSHIARLKPDGSVDESYKASIGDIVANGIHLSPQVFALALQPDLSVVVGGSFGSAASAKVASATRNNLARFTSAGELDTGYNPNANGMVLALALHVQNKIIAAGSFTRLQPNGSGSAITRNRIARLETTGAVDASFDPNADNGVAAVAVQDDGRVIIGGYFTTLQPNGGDTATTRNHLARLNIDGSIDASFTANAAGTVLAIAPAADGSVVIGGRFSAVTGAGSLSTARAYAAKINPDSTIDESFNPGVNSDVNAIVVQSDGKAVLGGTFTRAQPATIATAIVRNHLARVLPNGNLDTAFQLDQGGRILTSVTDKDGNIIVAGSFTSIGGLSRNHIARLKPNGSVDATYNPNLNGRAYALAYQSADNKVIVGGAFTTVGSGTTPTTRNHIARLNADGVVDDTFDPNIDGTVGAIVVQPDGKIVVGGTFSLVKPATTTDAVTRANILRLTSAGQVDTSFNPTTNSTVSIIVLQADQKLLIAGAFTALQPGASGTIHYRSYIARLNADGGVDTGFNPNPNSTVSAVAVQPADNKIVIGGSFTAVFPAGATAATTRYYLARLNADGSLDTAFDPHANAPVLAVAVQSDKKILVGGRFTTFQPNDATDATTRRYLARLNEDGKVDTSFDLALNEVAGNRVDSLALTTGGNVLVGGSFTSLLTATSGTRIDRNHFARITATGTVDTGFDPGAGGTTTAVVNALTLQPDGKIIVGGEFSDLGGATSVNLARFSPEGAADNAFNAALTTDGAINALAIRSTGNAAATQLAGFAWLTSAGAVQASFKPTISIRGRVNTSVVQSNGKVIIAGQFADVSGATTNTNIVRLNADGSFDASFSVTTNGAVHGMALQSDGKLVIVGEFTSVNGTTRNHVARVDTNQGGALDTTFDPNTDSAVYAVVIQKSDGAIVLGGAFTSLTAAPSTSAVTRNYIARVDKAGALDTTYNPNLNGVIYAMALDLSEKVVAGGTFTTAQPGSETTATTRNHLIRLQKQGSVDTSFDPNVNDAVYAVTIPSETDQNILIGGAFSSLQPNVNGTAQTAETHRGLARVGIDGRVDSTLSASTNGAVTSIAVGPNGSLLIAGLFTTVTSSGSSTPVARNHLAQLSSTGALDPQFNPNIAGSVSNVVIGSNNSLLVSGAFSSFQPTGLVLLGGAFKNVGGIAAPYVAQLNGDGSVNAAFQPGLDKAVSALLPLADGRFLVGGLFTKAGTTTVPGLARFKADGTLDTSFTPPANLGGANALALQADGKVLVGAGGLNGLVRLNTDGSLDNSFSGAAFAPAQAIVVQRDGKIVVAGPGSGVPTRVLRLNADGSVDATFTATQFSGGADVRTLTLQTDGSIIVAGSFTSINGAAISRLARLNANGSVDTSFNPAPNGTVSALALQSDGRLMIGGSFTTVGSLQRVGLARLGNTGAATQTLAVSADGKTITWLRTPGSGQTGTAGELMAVTFDISTDGQSWKPADNANGIATRIANSSNWQLTGVTVPSGAFIRARGIVPTSAGKSTGVYEAMRQITLSSPVSSLPMNVMPVVSSVPWDESHYVWTVDSAGVLRIADAFSGLVLPTDKTVLINGSSGHPTSASGALLADLATRGTVSPASPLLSGFAVTGTAGVSRQVLVRAIGPGLTQFGVTDALQKPQLRLYNNTTGAVVGSNNGWNNDAALSAVFARTGAFPLTPGSADSALVATLTPGTYSVQVVDGGASTSAGGTALVEIYDAGTDTSARLMNLSSRATVPANGTLIGGLVVAGNAPKTLLVRGVGPALTRYGVTGVLADPKVSVYDAKGTMVATNDNWSASGTASIDDANYAAAIRSAAATVGAFSFDEGSRDAALVIAVPAGAYTIQVSGVGVAAGAAMIEVYELP